MFAEKLYQSLSLDLTPWRDGSSRDIALLKSAYRSALDLFRELATLNPSGIETARARASMIDALMHALHASATLLHPAQSANLALVATGGYGRGLLNPCSDIDLLFLCAFPANKLPPDLTAFIEDILYPLWDLGLKVGHTARSVSEAMEHSLTDNQLLTSILESRLLRGSSRLHGKLYRQLLGRTLKSPENYLRARLEDISRRHEKFSNTVFLQEPNVKESPGGLRDFQNIIWLGIATRNAHSLQDLVAINLLTSRAASELHESLEFLHSVRNQLHFHANRSSDILTLHLQGVVATQLDYPERTILRKTESFMRDYYRHARAVDDRLHSVIEILQLSLHKKHSRLTRLIPFLPQNREKIDGFTISNGIITADSPNIFQDNPTRILRLFQICQMRGLDLPQDLRRLVKDSWALVDRNFRINKTNRETFQSILERKGDVARILRMMHRVGFLGRWLPEFGAMDCLVQHEFFHRYTADEHTLRCIEQLDALIDADEPRLQFYRRLLLDIRDPYSIYLALILHDSGRAENVREHTDGSAMLAMRVCNRLQITGDRRRQIMFLVDHHLSFWRFATTRNIDDEQVVGEFARIVKTPAWLNALMLFTYADSRGTNEESWSNWKESLMRQLYENTLSYLKAGDGSFFRQQLADERQHLYQTCRDQLGASSQASVDSHFQLMPNRYFHFREPRSVITHIRTLKQFLKKEAALAKSDPDSQPFCCATHWLDFASKGYTEFVIASRDRPFFIERLCCALASRQINILSAEIYTRKDGIILDILRLCDSNHMPVTQSSTRQSVENTFATLLSLPSYDPYLYLSQKRNFLHTTPEGIPFPVCAKVRNDLSPDFTCVEIQARDRIGLLHDLFHAIAECGLHTANARIATEKGAALDTLYVTDANNCKIADTPTLELLQAKIDEVVSQSP